VWGEKRYKIGAKGRIGANLMAAMSTTFSICQPQDTNTWKKRKLDAGFKEASKVCSKSIYTAAKDIKPEPTHRKRGRKKRDLARERERVIGAPSQ